MDNIPSQGLDLEQILKIMQLKSVNPLVLKEDRIYDYRKSTLKILNAKFLKKKDNFFYYYDKFGKKYCVYEEKNVKKILNEDSYIEFYRIKFEDNDFEFSKNEYNILRKTYQVKTL